MTKVKIIGEFMSHRNQSTSISIVRTYNRELFFKILNILLKVSKFKRCFLIVVYSSIFEYNTLQFC